MRTVLPLLLTVSAIGCRPDLGDPASLVTGTRLLAVRGDPPEAAAGAPVSYRALAASPAGTVLDPALDWAFCAASLPLTDNDTVSDACLGSAVLPIGAPAPSAEAPTPLDACALFGPDPPPGSFRPHDADGTGGYYQPVRVEHHALTAFRLQRFPCDLPDAPVAVAIQLDEEYQPNQNPTLAPLVASVNGAAVALDRTPAGQAIQLATGWGPGDAETYVMYHPGTASVVSRREALSVSWFVTAGTLADEVTGRAEDDPATTTGTTWVAPSAPGVVHVWLVLRDSRGGAISRSTISGSGEGVCRGARRVRILGQRRAGDEVMVMTRLGLAAVAALLGATAGCNLILGTTPPLPLGTAGSGSGGSGAGGSGSGFPTPCGDAEWTHWSPTGSHTYDTIQGPDGDSYVTDALTGLAWQTPAPGSMSAVTWDAARGYCDGLTWGGLQVYRLPTLVELASLTRYDLPPVALDLAVFSSATGGDFWTSTAAAAFTGEVFVLSYGDGRIGTRMTIATAGAWCVHDLKPAPDTGCVRYALEDGGASVRDVETGLVWQRTQSSGMKSWADAKAACKSLGPVSDAWRLPEVSELITLLDVTGSSPSGLDPQFFGGEPGDYYWTATADAVGASTGAWNIDMSTGVASPGLSSQPFYVRCVR